EGKYDIFLPPDTFAVMLTKNGDAARTAFLQGYASRSLREMTIDVRVEMEASKVIFLPEYSDLLAENVETLSKINPAVWNASVNLMRYSAFFRYAKEKWPGAWSPFFNRVSVAKITPAARTPTVMQEDR